jgi:subtilisin family serine protease
VYTERSRGVISVQFREKYHICTSFLISFVSAVFLLVIISQPSSAGPFPGEGKVRHAAVLEKASRGEVQDLIVIFDQSAAVQRAASLRSFSGADHDTPDILREKSMIFRNKKQEALNELTSDDAEAIEDYDQLPVMFLRVKSQKGLERLAAQPVVVGIYENQKYTLLLNESLPLIDQPDVAAAGYAGNGTAVAVLDSGVDYTIASAFGTCTGNNTPGDCLSVPVAHAGCRIACVHDFAPNDGALDDDGHGTNVSGIVAGVAPDAFIINLDVFRPDWYAYTSDITSAINWVIKNKDTYNIVSMK